MKKAEKKQNTNGIPNGNGDYSLQFGNTQHQGARNYQEDYFGFSNTSPEVIEERGVLALLCDGMGGLKGGRETAVETVSDILAIFNSSDFKHDFYNNMSQAVLATNSKIFSKYNSAKINTGCTLVSAYIHKNKLYWACVGDSRIYLARNGQMYALNEDHDYLNQLLDKHIGERLAMQKILSDPQKDSLTSFIGCTPNKLKVDISQTGFELQDNDTLIICSDGIYNSISECEMLRYITDNSADRACEQIVSDIVLKAKPGQDNMTVMLIKINVASKTK